MPLIEDKKIIGEKLYYFTFIYSSILMFILSTNYIPIVPSRFIHLLIYVAILFLFLKIFYFDSYDKNKIVWKLIIYILALVSWRLVKNVDILLFTSFIIGGKNVNYRHIIKLFVITIGIMLLGTIVVSQLGIVKDGIYIRNNFKRHSLGIIYPTDMGAYLFYIILGYLYLFFNKLSWKSFSTILFIDLLLYKYTEARNSCLLIFIAILVIWFAQGAYRGNKLCKMISSFYWMCIPLLAYCTFLCSWFFSDDSKFFEILNKLFSNRLYLAHKALNEYGITLFGQRIIEHAFGGIQGLKQFYNPKIEYFYIDSSFMRLPLIYGLLLGVFFIFVMTYIAYHSTLNHTYCLAAIFLLISLHCVVEQHLVDISFDPFLIAFLAKNVYLQNKLHNKMNTGDDSCENEKKISSLV